MSVTLHGQPWSKLHISILDRECVLCQETQIELFVTYFISRGAGLQQLAIKLKLNFLKILS